MTNSFVKICFFFLAHVPSEVPLSVGNLAIAANPGGKLPLKNTHSCLDLTPYNFPLTITTHSVYIPNSTTLES